MSKRSVVSHFTRLSSGIPILCLLMWPRPAAADAADVVTFNFLGTAICNPADASLCGDSRITVKGTFSFDPDAEVSAARVGPGDWSFLISSNNAAYNGLVTSSTMSTPFSIDDEDLYQPGTDTFYFESFDSSGMRTPQINLTFPELANGGSILNSGPGVFIFSNGAWDNFLFTAGTAAPAGTSATPEPSTLLLLGTGLLGVGPFIKFRPS